MLIHMSRRQSKFYLLILEDDEVVIARLLRAAAHPQAPGVAAGDDVIASQQYRKVDRFAKL